MAVLLFLFIFVFSVLRRKSDIEKPSKTNVIIAKVRESVSFCHHDLQSAMAGDFKNLFGGQVHSDRPDIVDRVFYF